MQSNPVHPHAIRLWAPVCTLTTKLQESVLNSGQTFGHWQLTMLSSEPIFTPLAANANGTHENTYDSTSVGLLAATYLDPEYQMLLEYQPF